MLPEHDAFFKLSLRLTDQENEEQLIAFVKEHDDAPRYRFLILDFRLKPRQHSPDQIWVDSAIELLNRIRGQDKLRRDESAFGWIDIEGRKSRLIAAVLDAPHVNWSRKSTGLFQGLNSQLSAMEVIVREFDRTKRSFSDFYKQYTAELFQFVSQVIENTPELPNRRPDTDPSLERWLDDGELEIHGFTPSEIETIQVINKGMKEYFGTINRDLPLRERRERDDDR